MNNEVIRYDVSSRDWTCIFSWGKRIIIFCSSLKARSWYSTPRDVERFNELKISRNILDVQNWSNIKHVYNVLFSFILHSEVCILVYVLSTLNIVQSNDNVHFIIYNLLIQHLQYKAVIEQYFASHLSLKQIRYF